MKTPRIILKAIKENRIITRQEIFNTVWKYFVIEKHQKSIDEYLLSCSYRSNTNKNACAIGCCIPDKFYKPYFEGKPISELIFGEQNNLSNLFNIEDIKYLSQLQSAHDYSIVYNFTENIKKQLIIISQKYNLNIPKSKYIII